MIVRFTSRRTAVHHRAVRDPVKDEDILSGFRSVHQSISERFEALGRRFDALDRRFDALEHHVDRQMLDVRNDVARLETRMRPFDEVDARVNKLETRVTRLEERIA
jgi:uncharacterized protein YceH (UPF0502 family)